MTDAKLNGKYWSDDFMFRHQQDKSEEQLWRKKKTSQQTGLSHQLTCQSSLQTVVSECLTCQLS